MNMCILFFVAFLMHWTFVSGRKSEVDSEMTSLMNMILTDNEFLSLKADQQYRIFRELYKIVQKHILKTEKVISSASTSRQ